MKTTEEIGQVIHLHGSFELFVPLNITLCPCLLSGTLLFSLSVCVQQHAFPLWAVVPSKSCCTVTEFTQA